ncbi:hypothetical protein PFISCL1PPCAC_14471, partial [Pristionchus fissidentatus]
MSNISAVQMIVARSTYGLIATVSLFGIISNFLFFLVIFRSSHLRSTTHILIGLCALLDSFHQIGQLYQFPILFSDGIMETVLHNFVKIIPEMGIHGGCACVLCIGLERLTAIVFFAHYKKMGRNRYLMHLLLILAYSLSAPILMIAYYEPRQV